MAALSALIALATAPLLPAAAASSIRPLCHSFLTVVSKQGHSRFEMHALCRARLSPDVCTKMLEPLSDGPWSPESIDSTCDLWDSAYDARLAEMGPERRESTASERLRKKQALDALNECVARKAHLAVCQGQSLEQCAVFKSKQYPEYTARIIKKFNDLISPIVPKDAMGDAFIGIGILKEHKKYPMEYEKTENWEFGHKDHVGAAMWVALSLALAGVAVSVTATILRRRQTPGPVILLGQEES